MLSSIFSTLSRDFSVLLTRRGFWWLVALWALGSAIIFFTYFDNFLAIQPTLRAKNFRYGVTDLVMLPYLKTLGIVSIFFMSSLCSRLFYQEHFAPFSMLFRSSNQSTIALIIAKYLYVLIIAFLSISIITLPVICSGFFFDYNSFHVIVTFIALFVLLLTVGIVAMVLSQIFSHSILVVLLTIFWVIITELAVKFIVEPTWFAPIIAFFSPITHINRIVTGVVTYTDVVFFLLLTTLLFLLSLRQFKNTYLSIY
ncbi:MAG: hypothetical protein ACWIPH_03570 [Ostreibacterium sp.]